MRKEFLKEHKPTLYGSLILSNKLIPHLNELDEQAMEFINQFIEQKSKEQNVNEKLKECDPMAWVGTMNSIKNQAEEAVMRELIYA